jgi:hypothetical protein
MTDEEKRQMEALRRSCERQAADITEQRKIAEYRNQQLRALHIVWCTGCTCASSEEITAGDVAAVEAYAARLRLWWANKEFKAAWIPTTPVNMFSSPDSCVNLTAPNWERLKIDVRERIDALAATMSDRCNAPPELKAKLWTDLVLPNVRLLSEFCANVTFDDDEREPLTDNTGCDS